MMCASVMVMDGDTFTVMTGSNNSLRHQGEACKAKRCSKLALHGLRIFWRGYYGTLCFRAGHCFAPGWAKWPANRASTNR